MKKLLVVLLALGLIAAFSMTASAADVKFAGQYYVVGVYESNRTLRDEDQTYSRAYAWTRTRVQTVFQVAEGLSFTTRFDAFEKQWGGTNRSSSATEDKSNSGRINVTASSGRAEAALQENIEMEYGFVTFKTKYGQWDIGYQAADEWGTMYADTPGSRPRARWTSAFGPVNLIAIWEKVKEGDTPQGTSNSSFLADADADNYMLAGIYNWKGGAAGLLYKYSDWRNNRPTANFRTQLHAFLPYMKGTFGGLFLEAEAVYITGKAAKYESPSSGPDIDKEGWGGLLHAKYTMGPVYFGGQFGYTRGNDTLTAASRDGDDKSGPASSTSWTPALIFGNANLRSWMYGQDIGGAGGTVSYNANEKKNLLLFNAYGGYNLTPKINFEGQFMYALADKKPYVGGVEFQSKDYGYEVDVKASYKIYDNLTYMVGAGYFWTGDYFKGTNPATQLGNDYILLNQLTLNF